MLSIAKKAASACLLAVALLPLAQAQQADSPNELIGNEQGNPIVTAVPFLTVTPDARAGAMGETGVATSPDGNAIYWNASKLAFIDSDYGATVSVTPWLQKIVGDMYIFNGSGFYRLNDRMTVGASMTYFNLGSMEFTDAGGNTTANYNPREYSFDGAFAMKLSDRFSIGGVARFIHSNLSGNFSGGTSGTNSQPANTAAVDISAFYKGAAFMLDGRETTVNWGLDLSNIGGKVTYSDESQEDFIPANFRTGVAITHAFDQVGFQKLTLAFDVNKLMVPTPGGGNEDAGVLSGVAGSFTDAPDGASEEFKELIYSVGAEYWYRDIFALRTGYFHEHEDKGRRQYVTLGVGLQYQVMGFDFAYLVPVENEHPLADTLRFTLRFKMSGGVSGEPSGSQAEDEEPVTSPEEEDTGR